MPLARKGDFDEQSGAEPDRKRLLDRKKAASASHRFGAASTTTAGVRGGPPAERRRHSDGRSLPVGGGNWSAGPRGGGWPGHAHAAWDAEAAAATQACLSSSLLILLHRRRPPPCPPTVERRRRQQLHRSESVRADSQVLRLGVYACVMRVPRAPAVVSV